MASAIDNRTTELHDILDEFEHECFMLRVEASKTRARDDVVRKSYESIRDEFAKRIVAALVSDREAELQSALNKAAGNWAKADALLREMTSGTPIAEQVREGDGRMSELDNLIHELRMLAGDDGDWVAGPVSATVLREAADAIEYLRYRLQESERVRKAVEK